MKKNHIITTTFAILCACITLSSFMLKTTGGHPSATGGPGELTCANATTGCHSTASVTNDNNNTVNTLLFSTTDSSYVPGQTYVITLKAQKSGITKFGFEIGCLRTSDNGNCGTWVITDAARTHTITGTGSLSTRKYVTHSTSGTPQVSPGLGQWSFSWKAPATNVGNVKFYYATNCTNNNAANTGDQLFISSFQIHPFSGTGIAEWLDEDGFYTATGEDSHTLFLNYDLKKECALGISLFDAQGKMVQNIEPEQKFAGRNIDKLYLSSSVSKGLYFVNLNIDENILTKKIIIQ